MQIFRSLSKNFSKIKPYLIQANMNISLEEHVSRSFTSAIVATVGITIVGLLVSGLTIWIIPLFFAAFLFTLYMFINYPYVLARKRMRMIDRELLFAGKHLLISLKSGVPLYTALGGLTSGYGELSEEMKKIVEKVSVGIPLHEAMKQVAETTPSQNLRRMLMQLVNSLLFGSEVTRACEAIVEEISKNQEVEIREYGQKLNPTVIGFLVLGIVFPSIGVAFAIIISTLFPSVAPLTDFSLVVIFLVIIVVQYMFISLVRSQRPQVL